MGFLSKFKLKWSCSKCATATLQTASTQSAEPIDFIAPPPYSPRRTTITSASQISAHRPQSTSFTPSDWDVSCMITERSFAMISKIKQLTKMAHTIEDEGCALAYKLEQEGWTGDEICRAIEKHFQTGFSQLAAAGGATAAINFRAPPPYIAEGTIATPIYGISTSQPQSTPASPFHRDRRVRRILNERSFALILKVDQLRKLASDAEDEGRALALRLEQEGRTDDEICRDIEGHFGEADNRLAVVGGAKLSGQVIRIGYGQGATWVCRGTTTSKR